MTEFSDNSLKTRKLEDLKEAVRGETPSDIQEKCLRLCAEYLGGSWNQISVEQIIVKRISGGFTNQLYYCGLAEGIQCIADEPKEVTVKLYGKKWINVGEDNERLSDMIIVLLASEYNLGPKIYGIYKDGEIAEYIKSRQFRTNEQNNRVLVREVSQKMAQFHALDVPLARETNWLQKYFDDCYRKAYQEFPIDDQINEVKAQNLIKNNLKQEYQWLLTCLDSTNSPVVFSHNDFRGSNILVHEDVDEKSSRRITLCDFEYSCYYYRGFDLAVNLSEFNRKELAVYTPLADDQVLEGFLRGYLDESIKIHGEEYGLKEQNSIKQLLNEVKVFSLASDMFGIMFLFCAKELPFTQNRSDIMRGANSVFGQYLQRKQEYKTQGLLPIP